MTPLMAWMLLFGLLLVLLAGGVWIAIALAAVAWFGLQFFTSTPPDVNLFQSFWGSSASWTLAALPLRFEANQGQFGDATKFAARGLGYGLSLTSTAAVLSLRDAADRSSIVSL